MGALHCALENGADLYSNSGMFIGNRCSHAHIKGGWPSQIRFKMAGKFKTTTNFLHYKPAYNGHNALAKRVYTGHSG